MSKKFSCPACGGEVSFQSVSSVFSVCPYCRMMLVRSDLNIESYGKMAELPVDSSVLQIGASGKYQNKSFTLVGRLRQSWSDGFWNEWYALFDDSSEGWLAEAQGFYMISFPAPELEKWAPQRGDLRPGKMIEIPQKYVLEVDDVKEATCVGAEGELPFRSPKGRKNLSVDLSGQNNLFGTIDYSEDGVRFYLGSYVDFDDLKLQGLRELNGW